MVARDAYFAPALGAAGTFIKESGGEWGRGNREKDVKMRMRVRIILRVEERNKESVLEVGGGMRVEGGERKI